MGKQTTEQQSKQAATSEKSPEKTSTKPSSAQTFTTSKPIGTKLGCQAWICKEKDERYGFCNEHFQQYKFGLITKEGKAVLDYERKLEHYQVWVSARKVA